MSLKLWRRHGAANIPVCADCGRRSKLQELDVYRATLDINKPKWRCADCFRAWIATGTVKHEGNVYHDGDARALWFQG